MRSVALILIAFLNVSVHADDRFAVENGSVYRVGPPGVKIRVGRLSRVTQILWHRHQLIARRSNGTVHVWIDDRGRAAWHEIGRHAVDLTNGCNDLFVLTARRPWYGLRRRRGVAAHYGDAGPWTLNPVDGRSVPTSNGRPVRLDDLAVPGAVKFEKRDGRVFIRTATGEVFLVSRFVESPAVE